MDGDKKKRSRLSVSRHKRESSVAGGASAATGTSAASVGAATVSGERAKDAAEAPQSGQKRQSIFLPQGMSQPSEGGSVPSSQSSQSKRKKVAVQRLGLTELDSFDQRELALAIRLSAEEAKNNPTTAPTHTLQAESNPDAAQNRPCTSTVDGAEVPARQMQVTTETPAQKGKITASVVKTIDAVSAKETEKKNRPRIVDSDDSDGQPETAEHTKQQAPSASSKRKRVLDSDDQDASDQDEERSEQAAKKAKSARSSKAGHSAFSAGPTEAVSKTNIKRNGRIESEQNGNHHDSDAIPDSEDDGESTTSGIPGETQASSKAENTPPPAKAKSIVVNESCGEHASSSTKEEGAASETATSAQKELPVKKGKATKTAKEKKKEMSTDGSQSDEAFSDEGDDDSDDDFVSDDDDFKGKKTKKSNLSRIKKGPAAMAKAPRNATAQSQRPAPAQKSSEVAPAAKKRKSKMEKLAQELAIGAPGVKVAGVAASAVSIASKEPVIANKAVLKTSGSDNPQDTTVKQKSARPDQDKAEAPSAAPMAAAGQAKPMACVPTPAVRPPPQIHVGEAGGGHCTKTVASLPPRVGLRAVGAGAPLHRAAAASSARQPDASCQPKRAVGPGMPAGQGVRMPGLHKKKVPLQQLHPRPEF